LTTLEILKDILTEQKNIALHSEEIQSAFKLLKGLSEKDAG
jgi:hypothetical protein